MSEILIVPMTAEHVPSIARIEAECFSTPWSQQSLTDELNVSAAVFITALIDGDVAGYMGMHHLGDVGYVCNVAVAPGFRRRGVASALIRAQIKYARANALSEISLEVRSSNEPARALYEKFGFVRLGTRPNFYNNPKENAEIYSLFLSDRDKNSSKI